MSNYDIQLSYEYNYEWYTIYIYHRYTMLYITIMLLMNVTFNLTSEPVQVEIPNKNDDLCQQAKQKLNNGNLPNKGNDDWRSKKFLGSAHHTLQSTFNFLPKTWPRKMVGFSALNTVKNHVYMLTKLEQTLSQHFYQGHLRRWRIVRKLAVFQGQQVGIKWAGFPL